MVERKLSVRQIIVQGMTIRYGNGYVTIKDSYKVRDNIMMKSILAEFKNRTGYKSRRSLDSWVSEWRTHNFLYRWGLFREHTRDCDLEECPNAFFTMVYWLLG